MTLINFFLMQAVVYGAAFSFLGFLGAKIFPRYRFIYHVKQVQQVHFQPTNHLNNVIVGYRTDATHDADTYSDCNVYWRYGEDCFGIMVSIEKEPISWFSSEENMVQIDSVEHRGCKSCGYTTNICLKSTTPFRIPCMMKSL